MSPFQSNFLAISILFSLALASSSCNQSAEKAKLEIPAIYEKDPHSFANIDQLRVTDLAWDAFIDVKNRKIEASEELTIEQVLSSEVLILDTKGQEIKSVAIASKDKKFTPAKWEFGAVDSLLGKALNISIKPDTRFVKIAYTVDKDAEGLLYMNADQTLTGKPFLFSQSESIFARSWLVLQDAPQVRFSFSARVRLPKGDSSLVLMSAPDNPKSVNPEGVYTFHQSHPIPSYLMSLAVGPLEYTSTGKRTGFYAESPWKEKASKDLAASEKMLESAEKCFGPYPWERYDVLVLPERFPFGGMENPCITYSSGTVITGDGSLVNVIIHEICHSWFGNLVTHHSWADIALTEGFTEWGELSVNRLMNGDDLGDMLWINEIAALKEELDGYGPEETKLYRHMKNPEFLFDNVPYNKGALFLEAVKNTLGQKRTLEFLRKYLKAYAWKDASVAQFLQFLKENTSAAAYTSIKADAWFYEPGMPDNTPKFSSAGFQAIENDLKPDQGVLPPGAASWNAQSWIHYLNQLYSQGANQAQLEQLEKTFHLSQQNSEIQMRFYRIAVKNNFEAVFPAMEAFLMKVGRKKFVIPIYKELCDSGRKDYTKKLIKKANYHPITQMAIEEGVPCAKP